jgi:hypothetical protein
VALSHPAASVEGVTLVQMTAAIAAPVPTVRPAPLDRLPGSVEDDPFLRLAAGWLVGHPDKTATAYRCDLEAWARCGYRGPVKWRAMGTSQAKMPSSSGGFRNYLKDPSRTTREYYDDGDGFRVAREDSGGASASTAACPTPSSTTSTLAAGTAWA